MSIDLLLTVFISFTILFLGAAIYLHNKRSFLNQVFVFISLATIGNIISVYYSLRVPLESFLFWVRATLFFAVPHSILFFVFIRTFPSSKMTLSKKSFAVIIVIMTLGMLAVASPYVFSGVSLVDGRMQPQVGPLIGVLDFILIGFVLSGMFLAIKRYRQTVELERVRWRLVVIGMVVTYLSLIGFIFVLSTFFDISSFVPFASVFMLPMIVTMAYAILKHRLLNTKVITTEIFTYIILVGLLSQVFLSGSFADLIIRLALFALFLPFGVLLNRSVIKEVEQREQLQELTLKLQDANKQLEELSHFKTQLLSLASHQVKAPLAAIKGFAQILIDGLYGPISDKVKETLIKMKRSSDTLIALINDLLDMRKVEEGKMEYQFMPLKVKDLVKEMFETLQPLASEKKLQFTLEAQSDATVSADAQKLKQVFANLAENAIKYTPSGFVKVVLKDEGGAVLFSVNDSGYGMSKELLPHLFEEFKRDEKVKNLIRGTGLGLFIAKKIVEAHGGQLWAESEGEGKGSTFIAKLPKVE